MEYKINSLKNNKFKTIKIGTIRKLIKKKNVHWKRRYRFTLFLITLSSLIFTPIGFFINSFYDVFFSICLGLFIGGIIMSILAAFLAEMSTHDLQNIDHVDHVDLGHVDHVDHMDHVDHIDDTANSGIFNDTTPAPFMLLFSTFLLLFGISGILFYYLLANEVKFLMFFATLAITYLITKLISTTWKKIAKSRYYKISSTQNLIGQKGVIILDVDKRGGVIKVSSNTPMKFERLHVKPLNPGSSFERGEEVYICDIKEGYLLVDNKSSSIRYRTG